MMKIVIMMMVMMIMMIMMMVMVVMMMMTPLDMHTKDMQLRLGMGKCG